MSEPIKRTKKENFEILADLVADNVTDVDEVNALYAFINNEIRLLDNKSKKTSLTPVQKENEDIFFAIPTLLSESTEDMTATKIGNALDLAVQRVSPIIGKLVESGDVVKTKVGKVVVVTLS